MFSHLKKLDWGLNGIVMLLVGIGFLAIYSISLSKGNFFDLKKQIIFAIISFILMIVVSFFDWKALKDSSFILVLYFTGILLLIGLLFFAPTIRGTKGWYKIGGISINPVDFVNLILIILLSKYFSKRHIEIYHIKHIFISAVYIAIPAALIFLQPDMGPVLIILSLWVGVLIISGIKIRHFLFLILVGILIASLGWMFLLKPYQKERIVNFVIPESDPLEGSWNQSQAKIAIGSGGFLGKGIGKGSQVQHGFLPEVKTDFIFSALAEETGFVGIFFIFLLFSGLLWKIISIALRAESNFPRLFAVGFGILIFSQIFIHICVNIGILPVIGLPLPFISYGGSNLVSFFLGLGNLQSIKVRQYSP
ncbi:MAG: FtsW/RodA/SpoVE family cell cycle protein [Minisyncoccales bacterium]